MANKGETARRKDSARLVWDTKPRRAPNPKDIEFQTAEVVLANPQYAGELSHSFGDGLLGEEDIDKQKMNRLIWGDNLLAMQALLAQGYEGKINLIYIDPPFDSKADYSHRMTIEGTDFTKEPSVIERLAYKDTWAGGIDSYLDMLYPRLQLMKRLLAGNGTIYVHLDRHASHYVKVVMDEIFGKQCFINEVVWYYSGGGASTESFANKHDVILFYSKNPEEKVFNVDDVRMEYKWVDGQKRADGSDRDLQRGKLPDDVMGLDLIKLHKILPWAAENTRFETQKPEALASILIQASSNTGDIVADMFAGSGTTVTIAEKLSRRWIGCELGKVGIQISRGRLVEASAKPFLIENIGNYQREMIYLTGGRIWEMQQLILKLYGATPRDKRSGLGVRRVEDIDELVYVGYPDRPVTAKKAEELAVQARNLDGRGYKRLVILGWDYEYNYRQALEARLKALNKPTAEIKSRDIPPDIYDYLRKARSEEDIEQLADKVRFYERPYLRVSKPKVRQRSDGKVDVILKLDRYVLMDIPVSQTTKKDRRATWP